MLHWLLAGKYNQKKLKPAGNSLPCLPAGRPKIGLLLFLLLLCQMLLLECLPIPRLPSIQLGTSCSVQVSSNSGDWGLGTRDWGMGTGIGRWGPGNPSASSRQAGGRLFSPTPPLASHLFLVITFLILHRLGVFPIDLRLTVWAKNTSYGNCFAALALQ